MAKKGILSETAKKIIVVVLFVVLGGVVIYNYVLTPTPSPKPKTRNPGGQATQRAAPTQVAQTPKAGSTENPPPPSLMDLRPLELAVSGGAQAPAKVGERGNIFAYWVAPPPPPALPPPPPPITLQMVQPQSVVAGTPRAFTLSVIARPLPADAAIYVDGSPRQTKRASETTLSTDIAASEYGFARTMNIEVKARSNPAQMRSNPVSLVIQAPPEPPFKYVGRLGDQGIFEMLSTKEAKRLKKGEVIQGAWRIDAFSDTVAEVTLTQYDIKKQMPIQEKAR